jgi:hypothetical protein
MSHNYKPAPTPERLADLSCFREGRSYFDAIGEGTR